ncbi:DHS-like NAD/FAD-binding domain-containing protein [Leucogyrophana mollusca]|uniref:DHS-like NAD/FAD-binding domain-containing protein n=1 Tax=Leucogyrophana mollusca TaxID=85980 RepID=A0ACB8BPQ4_9AGAM|nr:DHS-like NAD/FAD-binding domain-containing protein [Leucogyrophana mollusca]
MTVFLPLEASSSPPATPPFLIHTENPDSQMRKAVKAIMKARRLVVVCGAGISVQAGIPDFRSPSGLFQTLKRDNPKEALTSGKDLFDASVFNSEHATSLFCQMIARLSELSQLANPTPFHRILRTLDDRGGLLRVYTQNIDAIELKSGLSFGVPEFEDRRCKPRSKAKSTAPSEGLIVSASTSTADSTQSHDASRLTSPPVEAPRCIPLHGTLQTLHCQTCMHSFPLEDYIHTLTSGIPPRCPECTQMEEMRQLVGKRARGVGKLRPSVVLYNEMHKDGEGVGEIVRRDLMGSSKGKGRSGADLLLVVGTSLRVPGTKRMVREFAKAVRSRGSAPKDASIAPVNGLATPSPSPCRSPVSQQEGHPIKSIYLNFEFPVPTREWEGVFDAWVQGDAQCFANILAEEIEKEAAAKEAATERKRKREEEAALAVQKRKVDTKTPRSSTPKRLRKQEASDTPTANPRKPRQARTSTASRSRKSALPDEPNPEKTKLILRIPPRSKLISFKNMPVPEVYISTPAPKVAKLVKTRSLVTPPPSHTKRRSPSSAKQHPVPHYAESDGSDMSSSASTSKPVESSSKPVEEPKEEDAQPHLGVLEEDDEFEEFAVADWDDSETDLAHLNGSAPGVAKSGGDKLWEDNWDDDDIEDEFSVQLRNELAKTKAGGGDAMQH